MNGNPGGFSGPFYHLHFSSVYGVCSSSNALQSLGFFLNKGKQISFALRTSLVVEECRKSELISLGSHSMAHQIEIMKNVGGTGRVSPRVLILALQVAYVIYPILQISETFFSWTECKPSKDFLNHWKNVQAKFLLTFPTISIVSPLEKLQRFRSKLVLLYAFVPASLVAPAIAIGHGEISISSFFVAIHTAVILLEDTKLILTNTILADSFMHV